MANPYRAFRQLERKVFRGVPEQPEPISHGDINAQVAERHTGRSQLGARLPVGALDGAQLVATLVYNSDLDEVQCLRHWPDK